MPARTARLLDAVLDGGPYDHLPHVEEPIASAAPTVAGASSRASDRFVTTASSAV